MQHKLKRGQRHDTRCKEVVSQYNKETNADIAYVCTC